MYLYVCVCESQLFHGNHERREVCMYEHQVLNGISDGT